jgi:hypothetical protein
MVDTVREVGPELEAGVCHAPGTEDFAKVMKEWETLTAKLAPEWEAPESSVSEAFATTLTATHGSELFSVGVGFTQWYRHCGTGILESADPSVFLRDHEFYLWWLSVGKEKEEKDPDSTSEEEPDEEPEAIGYDLREFSEKFTSASYGRCLFTSEKGSLGLASPRAKSGDRVVYFPGSDGPFLLRKKEGEGWTLVSDCYLYGLDLDMLFHDAEHLVEDFEIY